MALSFPPTIHPQIQFSHINFLNSVLCSVQFCEGISWSTLFKTAFHSFILLFRRLALILISSLLPFSLIFYSILLSTPLFPSLPFYCIVFSFLLFSNLLFYSILFSSPLFSSILFSSILRDFWYSLLSFGSWILNTEFKNFIIDINIIIIVFIMIISSITQRLVIWGF